MEQFTFFEITMIYIIGFTVGSIITKILIAIFMPEKKCFCHDLDEAITKIKLKDLHYKHTPPAPERIPKPQKDSSEYIFRI